MHTADKKFCQSSLSKLNLIHYSSIDAQLNNVIIRIKNLQKIFATKTLEIKRAAISNQQYNGLKLFTSP